MFTCPIAIPFAFQSVKPLKENTFSYQTLTQHSVEFVLHTESHVNRTGNPRNTIRLYASLKSSYSKNSLTVFLDTSQNRKA